MKEKFSVVNIILTTRFGYKFKTDDFEKIIKNGKLHWEIANEEYCPILQVRIKGKEKTVHRKLRTICISFWMSGSVNIVGCRTKKEGIDAYKKAIEDIKQTLKE